MAEKDPCVIVEGIFHTLQLAIRLTMPRLLKNADKESNRIIT